jgi:hypothetical protein
VLAADSGVPTEAAPSLPCAQIVAFGPIGEEAADVIAEARLKRGRKRVHPSEHAVRELGLLQAANLSHNLFNNQWPTYKRCLSRYIKEASEDSSTVMRYCPGFIS